MTQGQGDGGNNDGFGGKPPGAPPAQGGFGAPPSQGGFGAPPSQGGFGAPPSQGGFGAPPSQGGFGAPPSQGGFGAPPSQGGFGAPPSQGGFGAPPAAPPGGFGAPPAAPPGGFGAPPSQGGFGAPPSQGGFGAPPSQGGFGAPPSQGGFGAPPPPKKSSPLKWVAIGTLVLAPFACCIGVGVWAVNSSNETNRLAVACSGVPATSARPYAAVPGMHPVLSYMRSGTSYSSSSLLSTTFSTTDPAVAELVLCVEEERKELVESCPFNMDNGSIVTVERHRSLRDVKIVVPSTGVVLAQTTLRGTEPAVCNDNESFYDGTTTVARDGDDVQTSTYDDFVRSYATGTPAPPVVQPLPGIPAAKF